MTPSQAPVTVTVCDKCLQASCWQGEFMCDEAKYAGVVEKTREELIALNLEHSHYWDKDAEMKRSQEVEV